MKTFTFNNVNDALPVLCNAVVVSGHNVPSRLGEQTREINHVGITLLNPLVRNIVVPHRNASHAAQIAESMWVLAGRNDIEWLSHYLPRAPEFSDDGITWRGGYGPRLRKWYDEFGARGTVDQLQHVLDVLRADPNSRRAVVSIYDAALDTQPGKDIPCNDFLNFVLRDGVLSLHVYVRSNDLIWGWSGINQFEWSVLLEVVAGMLGVGVGALHFSIGSLHIYDRHFEKARTLSQQTSVVGKAGVAFDATGIGDVQDLDDLLGEWFIVEERVRTNGPNAQAMVDDFPEPMLQSYLVVLQDYWTAKRQQDDKQVLGEWVAEDKEPPNEWGVPDVVAAARLTTDEANAARAQLDAEHAADTFADRVAALHAEKHAAYGDSWKRRGEMLGIMANIARKVDRLGSGAATPDESQVDTAIDLLVYLIKYRWWLHDTDHSAPSPMSIWSGTPEQEVSDMLHALPKGAMVMSEDRLVHSIETLFGTLEKHVEAKRLDRYRVVDSLIEDANLLARHRDWKAGNSTRRWEPSEEPEKVGAKGWPYRPTQPARPSQSGSAATEMGPLL